MKIILVTKYADYESALMKVDTDKLNERRENVCLKFSRNCLNNEKTKDLFKPNDKTHKMEVRSNEKYDVNFANIGRLQQSSTAVI